MAIKKKYIYKIALPPFDITKRHYCYELEKPLDLEKLDEAIKLFVGTHDFKNFQIGAHALTLRTIYQTQMLKKDEEIQLVFIGNSFLRGQIRLMVGLLVEYGLERISLQTIKNALGDNEHRVSYKAPAAGLYLEEIYY
jgi:tRNA pseudouridine38-40 synthase